MKIKHKLFLYFGPIFLLLALSANLICFFGLPFTQTQNIGHYNIKKEETFKNLNLISDAKEAYIKNFINNLRQNANSLGENQYLKLSLIDFLKSKGDKKEQVEKKINDIIGIFKSSYSDLYDEIQIFNQDLIFTTNKNTGNKIIPAKKNFELFLNKNKKTIALFNKQKVNNLTHRDLDIFRKIQIYLDNKPVTLILVFHVDTKRLIDRTVQTVEGLGKTGEVILLDNELKILTPLKFPLKDGSIGKPFEYAIKTKISNMGTSGMTGSSLTTDYRGKLTLSSFRGFDLGDQLTFVMITKKDIDEIFAPVNESFLNSMLVSFSLTMIALFLIHLISRSVTFPISNLVKTANQIKDNNYLEKLNNESEDEVSPIVEMLNDLIGKYQSLEKITTERADEDKIMYEKKLLMLNESVENSTRLKDKFVSLVAHDLRSPIASIEGLLKILLKKGGNLEHYQFDIIETIIKSVKKMQLLISDILNISRIKSGKIKPNYAFLNLSDLINSVIEQHAYKALAKSIEIKNEININARIYTDKALFAQVIDNIISNAIKFCRKEDTISISEEKEEPYTLKVTDTGTGIHPKIIDGLFKFDQKTSLTGTSGEIGTGLGLPFAYELMIAMGGDLKVSSTEFSGSTFYLSLPYIKPNILVVDDESLFISSISVLLKNIDTDIMEAENGKNALSIIADNKPALIISDINMPVMDGFELLKILKSDKTLKYIPVIMVTSLTGIEIRDKAFSLGADDFINKPFKKEELIPRVRRFLS